MSFSRNASQILLPSQAKRRPLDQRPGPERAREPERGRGRAREPAKARARVDRPSSDIARINRPAAICAVGCFFVSDPGRPHLVFLPFASIFTLWKFRSWLEARRIMGQQCAVTGKKPVL